MEQAIISRHIPFWNVSRKSKNVEEKQIMGINKRHKWYYQIQGKLPITKRQICMLIVWTTKWIHIEKIERDDAFWKNQQQLKKFYHTALLPEILYPRQSRSMPLRSFDTVE